VPVLQLVQVPEQLAVERQQVAPKALLLVRPLVLLQLVLPTAQLEAQFGPLVGQQARSVMLAAQQAEQAPPVELPEVHPPERQHQQTDQEPARFLDCQSNRAFHC
jgi:hypothetical protein